MRRSISTGLGLLASLMLVCSASERPVLPEPTAPLQEHYTIEGGSLTILSHPKYREFRYEDGVVFSGDGISITAGELVLQLRYGDLDGRDAIKLPSPKPGELERDPPGTAAVLAREIYLPSPELTPDMLKLIEASKGVVVESGGMKLSAPRISSTDGATSWKSTGGARISVVDAKTGGIMELATDDLTFNMENQTGRASGNIKAHIQLKDQPEINLTAQQLSFDLERQSLTASDGLEASSGDATLCCGMLVLDLAARTLSATGRPSVGYSPRQLTLIADEIRYNIKSKQLSAAGSVMANDGETGASLNATQVEYDAAGDALVATGQPRLSQGQSFYTGETLRVTREEGGRLIVEIEGRQSGRIDLSQFESHPGADSSDG